MQSQAMSPFLEHVVLVDGAAAHVVRIQYHPPRVSPGKWHRVPLMVIRDRAHPICGLGAVPVHRDAASGIPARCFSVIEQTEYAVSDFLTTHLTSVVVLVGETATGYPVHLSQDTDYHLYRQAYLSAVVDSPSTVPDTFEGITKLCLHGTFYVYTAQLCVALTQSRYLRLVQTSLVWSDAVRLVDHAAWDIEATKEVTISMVEVVHVDAESTPLSPPAAMVPGRCGDDAAVLSD